MQVENGVSKKDPSKTRRSLLPSMQMRTCGVKHGSEKNCSIQNRNTSTCLLCSSFFRVDSSFGMLFATKACLPQAWFFRRYSSVALPKNYQGCVGSELV